MSETKTVAEVLGAKILNGYCGQCSRCIEEGCDSEIDVYTVKQVLNQTLKASDICVVDVDSLETILARGLYVCADGQIYGIEDCIEDLVKANCVKFKAK